VWKLCGRIKMEGSESRAGQARYVDRTSAAVEEVADLQRMVKEVWRILQTRSDYGLARGSRHIEEDGLKGEGTSNDLHHEVR
jgi:hypothetical protein